MKEYHEHMDTELLDRLTKLENQVDRIWRSVEQTRKIFLWTTIIGVILFILPLIGLAFVVPQYLKTLNIQQYLQ